MSVRPQAEYVLVQHAGDFLRRIGDALAGGGHHRLLNLAVSEARDHRDDDEDQRCDEKRQLSAQWLLQETKWQDARPHFDLEIKVAGPLNDGSTAIASLRIEPKRTRPNVGSAVEYLSE
jgi:hypothetical protein